jgi:uncharacterized membrane protein YiaA
MSECKYCGCEIPEKSYYIEACVGCIFGPIDYLERLCDDALKEENEKTTDYSSLRWVNGDGSKGN